MNLTKIMELKLYVKYCSENWNYVVPFLHDFVTETDPLCYSIVLPCSYREVYEVRIVGVYNCVFTSKVLEDENIILIYKLFFRTCIFPN